MGDVSFGRHHSMPLAPGTHLCLTHQSSHPFAGDASPLIAQLLVNARTAISALMGDEHLSDLLRDLSIFSVALTDRTLARLRKTHFPRLQARHTSPQ